MVVVGAGLAGLIAARDLVLGGATVLVLEARDRVGGRVLSRTLDSGATIDLGGQWIGPFHDRLRHATSSFGIERYPTPAEGVSTLTMGDRLYNLPDLVPDLPRPAQFDLRQVGVRFSRMLAGVPIDEPWRAPHAAAWDRITAASWIERNTMTKTAREFLQVAVEVSFGFEPDETSLLGLLFDVKAAGSIRRSWEAQAESFVPGAQALALRLAQQLGDRVLLERPVIRITELPGEVRVASGTASVRADRVAVCLPPALVSRIEFEPPLPQARRRLLDGLPPGRAIKIIVVYRERFWLADGRSGQTLNADLAVGVTYDVTPPSFPGGVLLGLSVAAKSEELRGIGVAERRERIVCELARLFGSRARQVEELYVLDWTEELWTGGCYAAHFTPGTWTDVGPVLREPTGRIHWGGTETAAEWHGYMEGAVRSGERVAAELLTDLS